MKNQNNLKSDAEKFSSFSNGMKKIYIIFVAVVLFLIIPSISSAATCGTVQDADGNTYNTVVIGTQCWMAENLRTTKKPDGTSLTEGSGMYSNPAGFGSPWGRFYNWTTAMNIPSLYDRTDWGGVTAAGAEIQGICPNGWHIPSEFYLDRNDNEDWQKLSNFLGGDAVAGGKMKSTDATFWTSPNTGASNSSGFSGVATGFWEGSSSTFRFRGTFDYFWSSAENGYANAWDFYLRNNQAMFSKNFNDKRDGLSVRCIANPDVGTVNVSSNISSSWTITGPMTLTGSGTSQSFTFKPSGTYTITWGAVSGYATPATQSITLAPMGTISFNGTYTTAVPNCGTAQDVDGNTYNTVVIGNQCWMAENLRTTKKPDGTSLTEGSGMYSNPLGFGSPWGRLYDWNTAMNGAPSATAIGAEIQGICPDGWHIPSDYNASASDDFQTLSNFLGGDLVAGGKMKQTGTTYWDLPNIGATNSSGFAGVASGFASPPSTFSRGANLELVTSSEHVPGNAWQRSFSYGDSKFIPFVHSKTLGHSVRCIQGAAPPVNQLKICRNSCDSGTVPLVNLSDNLTMLVGDTSNLIACYNTSSACDMASGDVTATTTWTEGGGSAVSLSGISPKVLTADNSGTETISAAYSSATSQFTANISAVPVCNGCEANTCVGSPCDNNCGNSSAPGTKVCSTGGTWKEVAP